MSFTLQVLIFSSFPFILAILVLKSYISSSSSSKNHKNLPPSPPKLPLIGNLHQLGSSPHRSLHAIAQNYGPVMLLRFGSVPVLIVSSVKAAREMIKTHDLAFASRPALSIPRKLFYELKDIGFAEYGEYWRQLKSITVLHLLSHKRVQSYRQVREEEMDLMMEKIQKANESVVNLSGLLASLTNNIICRVTLGKTYDGRRFKRLFARAGELVGCFSVGSYIPSLRWVDRLSGIERRTNQVFKELDEFLDGVVDGHVTRKGDLATEYEDLVDILLDIQRDNRTGFQLNKRMIKATILDLLIGGTDTTSTSLEWAIAELLRHPQAMKKLQQEAREIGQGRSRIVEEDLEKMPYLKAVLKEALRLHTPLPLLVPHESTQDVKLFGYDIPSGTQVHINAWAIARDPSKWEAPEDFKPERFLSSSIDYKGLHYELIPFGAGRRRCPGIQFSIIINEIVLANLVYKFDLASMGEGSLDLSETNGITVSKKYPIMVSATPVNP